ncbi:MAG: FG-GAP-like repeat-containing protein [bacterium]|nr:FG-GAP-like repeat-containing protein [bacterium]
MRLSSLLLMPSLPFVLACLVSAAIADEPLWQLRFERQQLTETYFSEGVAVGDLNADGHQDVVYGPYWFAGPDFTEKHEIYPAVAQPMERYADNFFSWVYDFDGDGAQDIFVVGFPGTPAHVYQNPGKGVGSWTKKQVFDWVSNESPQFVNLLGDERPELVCTRDGFFGFATIDWDQPFKAWTFHAISEQVTATRFGHGLGIGDINGDGLQDVLHAGGWYQQPATGALNGRWQHHPVAFSTGGGGAEMYAYDVDGDGDQDVITSESAHNFGLSWYEQKQEGQFVQHLIMGSHPSENRYGVLFSELHSVNLADVDGDGLKDILTGKTYWSHHRQSPMWDAGAVVYWFRLTRQADGTVDWIPYQIHGETGIGRQLTVADINADGQLDVAVGGMLGANVLIQQRTQVSPEEYASLQPQPYRGPKQVDVDEARALRGPPSPIGKDGAVVDAIEGEELNAQVSAGEARHQDMSNFSGGQWSGRQQLWWTGGKPGDRLTLELNALQEIEAIQMVLTCARDYGIFRVYLDDQPLADPIDLYNDQVINSGLLEFKTSGTGKGKHKLEFEIVGANRQAVKAYMLGLDFIRFRGKDTQFVEPEQGIRPKSADGRELNLDFETGSLTDWTAEGDAFAKQPVQGDLVSKRRRDMSSQHLGEYWIGGYETQGDKATGTLTSAPFVASSRFGSFYMSGGSSPETRVELWTVGEDEPFYTVSGRDSENLSQVIVDLRRAEGREMFIRLVDASTGGWGHLNFDHFRLHAQRPGPLTPANVQLVDDEYPHRGLSAEQAAAAMKLPDGFEVTVCAAEPDVKQPIAMALDDRGRVWIAEAYEYPQRAAEGQGRDRILIFEDTTGDGQLDSRKVFQENLNLVSGLEVGFGGVWVGAAPYLLFIPDRDQDDIPDGPPEVLLDGWGYQDTHETLNAFIWGPDGWLYGCHGVFTHSKVGKPGTPEEQRIPINAGVWRYHPTRHQFEVFAHGTSNPWGVDFNAHGEAFITACVIPHLYHMIPGGRYQRQAGQHFNPYTYDDIKTIADHLHYLGATPHAGNNKSDAAGGGHAHAGAMIYQGGLWPEEYDGVLFMNNIHGQRLNTDRLIASGSGYVGEHGPDFLLTGDMASQILNMRYGPDGNVIFIDWYDMQACHRREAEVHDRSNGRIYKIWYQKDPTVKPLKLDLAQASDLELAEMCLHENDWFVRHARRLLQERTSSAEIDVAAVERLQQILRTHSEDTRRLRAAWSLHAIGGLDDELTAELLQDSSPHVRQWGIRLGTANSAGQLDPTLYDALLALAREDSSPVVRRGLASAIDRMDVSQRWSMIEALVHEPMDADDHNLPLLYWYIMEPLAAADADRALALGMAAGQKIPLLREYMLRRIGGTGSDEALGRLVKALDQSRDAQVQRTFLNAIRSALAGQRDAQLPDNWADVYARLIEHKDATLRLQALGLGVRFGDQSAASKLRNILADTQQAESIRQMALQSMLEAKHPSLAEAMLVLAANEEQHPPVRLAAIRGLAQYPHPLVASTLLAHYGELNDDCRRAAVATLAARTASAQALLVAIAAGEIPASDLTADQARQIEYLDNKELSQQLAKVWGQVRESSQDRAQIMADYKSLIERSDLPDPDAAMGRQIFGKTCQRCHVLYGVGEKLGPDLTGSNRANLDYLMENIVDPSAVMANEYRQSIFLTEDGQVITGIVQTETENAITIQTAEAVVVLPQAEIVQRKDSEQSMMPENQLSQFSEHEIRSLIAYLRGKEQVPLPSEEKEEN